MGYESNYWLSEKSKTEQVVLTETPHTMCPNIIHTPMNEEIRKEKNWNNKGNMIKRKLSIPLKL